MPDVLITVGMTAYNAAATLPAALESALTQQWENFEIVIVDDGSTDATPEILATFGAAHPQIRVYRQENQGVATARNRIIQEAQGKFIAFFDDDDVSAPGRLPQQFARLTDYERNFAAGAPVICHTARQQLYPHGHAHYEPTLGMAEGVVAPHGHDVAALILFNRRIKNNAGSMASCSQMARRSVYVGAGGFDAAFRRSEDTEFNLRLALTGAHFAGVAAPLVRQTMNLSSDKKLAAERFFTLQMYNKHRAYLEEKGRHDFDYRWMQTKYDFLEKHLVRFFCQLFRLFLRHPLLTARRLYYAGPSLHANRLFQKFHHDQR